ncbi:WbqC-like protein family protein [Ekhidna lutea]|uniref:WbqC-like protein family protein n=1 Tax=Ekhidna lutea TaxID=447679 RepID=A0A239FVT4_EKHLU|nr:WbqC family protein [Ekhidna lutea]SNS60292.1 WbqC-like protein family protein [Ekhidna lutea]
MSKIIIEPHYLGSLEYYALLMQFEEVCLEINDSFPKQTYRNRAHFLTANKVQTLVIPVRFENGSPTKDVQIDHSQRWLKDHWGAFYSAYGKAPFFEYFSEDFKNIWDNKISSLIELNLAFMEMVFKVLQRKPTITYTAGYEARPHNDFRNVVNPKKPFSDRKIYSPYPYPQLFGDTFVPNLSIVDLIMCEGPNAAQILMNSFYRD